MAGEALQSGDQFGLEAEREQKEHKSPCDHPGHEDPGVPDPDLSYRVWASGRVQRSASPGAGCADALALHRPETTACHAAQLRCRWNGISKIDANDHREDDGYRHGDREHEEECRHPRPDVEARAPHD